MTGFTLLSDVLQSASSDRIRVPVLPAIDFSAGCERPVTLKHRRALIFRCERVVVDAIDVSCGWCNPCRERKARRIIKRAAALVEGATSVRLVTLSPSMQMHLEAEAKVREKLVFERDHLESVYPDHASQDRAPFRLKKRLDLLQQLPLEQPGLMSSSGLSDAAERFLTRARRKALYPAVQRYIKRVRHHHKGWIDVTAVAEKHPGDKPGGSGQLTGHIHFHVLFSVRQGRLIGRKLLKRALERQRSLERRDNWFLKISRLRSASTGEAAAKYLGAAKYVSKDTVFAVMSYRRPSENAERRAVVRDSGATGAAFELAGRETVSLSHWEAMRTRNNIGEIVYRSWDVVRPWVDIRNDAAFVADEPPF